MRLLALLAVAACGGSSVEPDALEAVLAPLRSEHALPALGAAVFSGEGLVAIGAVGERKLGDPTPVTREDRWHLGSETKAMTATLIAIHVAEGRIGWETTLAEAFPVEAAAFDPAWREVTIAMLLRHRGGAPANLPADVKATLFTEDDPPGHRRAAVVAMLSRPPETPAGGYVYSNAGYMMAAAALENRLGATWDALIRARLFAPLSMSSCGLGPPSTPGKVDQPWGHRHVDGTLTPNPDDNPPAYGPAGTVHCSLADWGKFLAVHLRAARGQPTPLGALDFARLQTPPAGEGYAFGWFAVQRDWGGGTVLTHHGSNTLW